VNSSFLYGKLIVGTCAVALWASAQTVGPAKPDGSAAAAQPSQSADSASGTPGTASGTPTTAPGTRGTASGTPATASATPQTAPATSGESANYVLGPDDQIIIRAVGIDEFNSQGDGKPAQIDMRGYVDVPIVGHVKAAGLRVQELEAAIREDLRKYVRDPHVTVTVAEYKSEPVSIVGSVTQPGVYHLSGQNTLVQVLSQAQGLSENASNKINITRDKAQGPIPLPGCAEDSTGKYYTASVNTKLLLDARDPSANIKVKPNDVIAVPKAEMVYVVGAVNKSGAFVLNERESISVLQALSMAEGLGKAPSTGNAKIIRRGENNQRIEIPADVKKILSGKAPDMPLYANDILFIPTSAAKSVSLRALEAAIQVGTGLAIYGRY
jgi:polysaccharide biosynthesis/export protein